MEKRHAVCPKCGSEDIVTEAVARWNIETQEWELSSMYDFIVCCACDGESDAALYTCDPPS